MAAALIFLVVKLFIFISAESCENRCTTCKVFSSGLYEGKWNLKDTDDWRCADSCLYQRANDSTEMCFCDPGTIKYQLCTESTKPSSNTTTITTTSNPSTITTATINSTPKDGYVLYDNSPGCGDAAVKDREECGLAAKSLGFTGYESSPNRVNHNSYPPGCFVLQNHHHQKKFYWNSYTGTDGTGRTDAQSVCHKK
jgi:hypothetical protein